MRGADSFGLVMTLVFPACFQVTRGTRENWLDVRSASFTVNVTLFENDVEQALQTTSVRCLVTVRQLREKSQNFYLKSSVMNTRIVRQRWLTTGRDALWVFNFELEQK